MKSLLYVVVLFSVLVSCKSESSKSTNNASSSSTTADSDFCFEKKFNDGTMYVAFTKDADYLSGTLNIKSKAGENFAGEISGSFTGEEYILDLKYKVGDDNHSEKIIFEYDNQSARLARSGSVNIEGTLTTRNEGESTLDVLDRVDC